MWIVTENGDLCNLSAMAEIVLDRPYEGEDRPFKIKAFKAPDGPEFSTVIASFKDGHEAARCMKELGTLLAAKPCKLSK